MKFRWFALGFAAGCVTLGVFYAVIEWSSDDDQTQAIVIDRFEKFGLQQPNAVVRYCVSYSVFGAENEICADHRRDSAPACYLDAERGKRLPSSCQFSE